MTISPSAETAFPLGTNVDKRVVRQWSRAVQDAVEQGQASGFGYTTLAALNADLAHPANTKAEVYADPTPTNNGVYLKSGASGAGAWTKVADLGATTLDARIDDLEATAPIAVTYLGTVSHDELALMNGAVKGLNFRTITTPVGQTGRSASITSEVRVARLTAGTVVKYKVVYITSPNFTAETPLGFVAVIVPRTGSATTVAGTVAMDGTQLARAEYTHTVGTLDERVQLILTQSASASVRTSEGSLALNSIDAEIISSPAPIKRNAEAANYRALVIDQQVRMKGPIIEQLIIADGGGHYTSPSLAMSLIGQGAGHDMPARARLLAGTYADLNVTPHDYMHLEGAAGEHEAVLNARSAPGVPGIGSRQPVLVNKSSTIEFMTIHGENNWHALHGENGNLRDPQVWKWHDLVVQNFGTEAGGSATAYGVGVHSGCQLFIRRSKAISPGAPTGGLALGIHDNIDWERRAYVEASGLSLIAQDDNGIALALTSMGSGMMSVAEFHNICFSGSIYLDCNQFLTTTVENHRAYRYGWKLMLEACGPVDHRSTSPVPVLELRSIAHAASRVSDLAGTARPYLFGRQPFYKEGGVGYAARAYGQNAIGLSGTDGINSNDTGMPTISLRSQLGDMSSATKILTMNIDGGSFSITLDQNYGAMASDAAVITNLNAKLVAAGVGGGQQFFITSAPYDNRAPIYQPGREGVEKNVDTTAILKGHALAWSGRNVRRMTSADAVDLFAGIALDEAMAGKPCRFQRSGFINQVHLLFTGVPAVAARDRFRVGGTPGELVEDTTGSLVMRARSLQPWGATFEFIGREN